MAQSGQPNGQQQHFNMGLFLKNQARMELGTAVGPDAAGVPSGQTQTNNPSTNKTQVLNGTQIARASNAFSIISHRANQVMVNEDLNFVGFIHRQNVTQFGGSVVENGIYRMTYSTDGGSTFPSAQTDIGPLNPTPYPNPGRGRYPNVAIDVPSGATTANDIEFAWMGAMTDGSGWGNYNWGNYSDIGNIGTNGNTIRNANINFSFLSNANNRDVIIPGSMTRGEPGEFWFTDAQYDNAAEASLGGLRIYKGTLNAQDSVEYAQDTLINLRGVFEEDCANPGFYRVNSLSDAIAFDPSGQFGWVAMTGDIIEPTPITGYEGESDIVLYRTTNGGDDWTGPFIVKLRDYPTIVNTITDQPGQTGPFPEAVPTISTIKLAVDKNGNPHVFGLAIASSQIDDCDSLDFISTVNQLAYFDITSYDQGQTFCPKLIALANGFRGSITGTGLEFGTYPQISMDEDGEIIHFGWIDDEDDQQPQNAMSPDLFGRAININNENITPIENFSNGDADFDNAVFYPQHGQRMLENNNNFDWQVPVVFLQIVTDELRPVNFIYTNEVGFDNADFTSGDFDLAVDTITAPVDQLCPGDATTIAPTVSIENNGTVAAGASDYVIDLRISGPKGDTLFEGSPVALSVGASQTITFPNYDFDVNGTYTLSAVISGGADLVCANNVVSKTVLSVGGASQEIIPTATIQGCGQVLLDAGLSGATTTWTDNTGSVLSNNQQYLITAADIGSIPGGEVSVSVDLPGVSGCSLEDTVTVVINPDPVVSVASQDACAGTNVTLTATDNVPAGATYSFNWDINTLDGTLPGAANQTTNDVDFGSNRGYFVSTVRVTDDATGCFLDTDVEVKIWEFDLDFSDVEDNVCDGDFIDAASSTIYPGALYDWHAVRITDASITPTITYAADNDASLYATNSRQNLQSGWYRYGVKVRAPEGLDCPTDTEEISITNSDTIELSLHVRLARTDGTTFADFDGNWYEGFVDKIGINADSSTRINSTDTLTMINGSELQLFNGNDVSLVSINPEAFSTATGTFARWEDVCNASFVYSGSASSPRINARVTLRSGACVADTTFDGPVETPTVAYEDIIDTTLLDGFVACRTISVADAQSAVNSLALYPNPTSGNVQLALTLNRTQEVSYQVFNLQGQLIETRELSARPAMQHSINLADQPAGLYLVKVQVGSETLVRRIIKD